MVAVTVTIVAAEMAMAMATAAMAVMGMAAIMDASRTTTTRPATMASISSGWLVLQFMLHMHRWQTRSMPVNHSGFLTQAQMPPRAMTNARLRALRRYKAIFAQSAVMASTCAAEELLNWTVN
ncbi:hypothetical protein GGH17_006463 [Coemansia sp. RSA 788]|nr:hypothetical protein GGH17_006463 [Coemansia sp. RSA 788]